MLKSILKRKFKSGLVSIAFLIAGSGLFASAQMFSNFPQVGSASYCSSTVNGTCVSTIPAGPTIVTGLETIPADTNASGGQSPQTVKLGLGSINAFPLAVRTLTNATSLDTYTIAANTGGVVYNFTGTIPSATITTPASPIDGQRFSISSNRTITTLTVTANTGSTLAQTTPTVLTISATAPQGYEFTYNSALTQWFRIR